MKPCDCTIRTDEDMKRIRNEFDPYQLQNYYVEWGCSYNKSDSKYYFRVCNLCKRIIKGENWVKKHKVAEWIHLSKVPLIQDLHVDVYCSHTDCQKRGTEDHHWAPKAIFGINEADAWPIDPLCVFHHNMWHDKMKEHFAKEKV